MHDASEPFAVELRAVTKDFGGSRVLHGVDLSVRRGEVVGLVGENGSGKSTLVKILGGFHEPNTGASLRLWGEAVSFPVSDPSRLGVQIVHQDLALVEDMTALENLGVTTGFGTRAFANIDFRSFRRRAQGVVDRFGVAIDLDVPVADLDPADRAALAIVRCLLQLELQEREHGLIILDEPTAYLSGAEASRVADVVRSVTSAGSSVIFISHHMHEILTLADSLTILRNGAVVESCPTDGLSERDIIAKMLGRDLVDFYPAKVSAEPGNTLMSAIKVSGRVLRDVDLDVRAREILGVTGLVGMGHQELPYLLSGAQALRSGTVRCGPEILGSSPVQTLRQRVALIPANRTRDGVWTDATVSENLSLPVLARYFRRGRLDRGAESRTSDDLVRQYGVTPTRSDLAVGRFSGGNQQKVLLAKWLQTDPSVLLLDEPTQGVDAGARREILQVLVDRAERGTAIVIFSSDHEQLVNVCNRVVVIVRGRIHSEVSGAQLTEDELLTRCHAA